MIFFLSSVLTSQYFPECHLNSHVHDMSQYVFFARLSAIPGLICKTYRLTDSAGPQDSFITNITTCRIRPNAAYSLQKIQIILTLKNVLAMIFLHMPFYHTPGVKEMYEPTYQDLVERYRQVETRISEAQALCKGSPLRGVCPTYGSTLAAFRNVTYVEDSPYS